MTSSSTSRTSDACAAGAPPGQDDTTARDVRAILASQGRLSVPVEDLANTSDLHSAGLTSLATVSLMLALEDHFHIEFPDSLLSRKTFSSISALAAAIDALRRSSPER